LCGEAAKNPILVGSKHGLRTRQIPYLGFVPLEHALNYISFLNIVLAPIKYF
jgi:hypothetical protein